MRRVAILSLAALLMITSLYIGASDDSSPLRTLAIAIFFVSLVGAVYLVLIDLRAGFRKDASE